MVALYATRGLPASGKTTYAKAWVNEAPNRVRINRDDLREMIFGGWTGKQTHERAVTVIQRTAIGALLHAGYDVVCDDTNLRPIALGSLRYIAECACADFEVWDMTGVPVEICIERDAARLERGERAVGESVIRRMHAILLESDLPVKGSQEEKP